MGGLGDHRTRNGGRHLHRRLHPRYRDTVSGAWEDGETLFLPCSLWRQAAENAGESITKGTRVIATGRLRQRSYTTTDGDRRTVIELDVDEIGPSLRHATAIVKKTNGIEGHRTEDRGQGSD